VEGHPHPRHERPLDRHVRAPDLRHPALAAYGLLLGQWPLIVTNGICLALSGFILAMKLLPRRHREVVAEALDPAP
jgi:hypothetical protein